jgi:hypothetical protein
MAETSVFEYLYHEELYSVPTGTMVLIDRPWADITEEHRILLGKILGSVRLSPATVQILERKDLSTSELAALNPRRVISFGVKISPVQKLYEHVPLDGMHLLLADSLPALDDARKKSLWLALKQMFGLS